MTAPPSMCYAWLYLRQGIETLPQLVHALSIPSGHVVAGEDSQAVDADIDHLNESGLHYFVVNGDFSLSCDIRLAGGWTVPAVKAVLLQLSASGLCIAMTDDSSDSPFDCLLFDAGSCRPVTLIQDDTTDKVTLYFKN